MFSSSCEAGIKNLRKLLLEPDPFVFDGTTRITKRTLCIRVRLEGVHEGLELPEARGRHLQQPADAG